MGDTLYIYYSRCAEKGSTRVKIHWRDSIGEFVVNVTE